MTEYKTKLGNPLRSIGIGRYVFAFAKSVDGTWEDNGIVSPWLSFRKTTYGRALIIGAYQFAIGNCDTYLKNKELN